MHKLVSKVDRYDLYLRFSSDLSPVRLVGSNRVIIFADNLLNLFLDPESLDLKDHPTKTQEFYEDWRLAQKHGIAFGWKAKLSSEERLSIIVASRIFLDLLSAKREEIQMVGGLLQPAYYFNNIC